MCVYVKVEGKAEFSSCSVQCKECSGECLCVVVLLCCLVGMLGRINTYVNGMSYCIRLFMGCM